MTILANPPPNRTRSPFISAILGLFILSCFSPYPAVALTSTIGLQISHLLSVGVIFILLSHRLPSRHLFTYMAVFLALLLAGIHALSTHPRYHSGLIVANILVIALALLPLLAGGIIDSPSSLSILVPLVSSAIILHGCLGILQYVAYRHSHFPAIWLYKNPSFRAVEELLPYYAAAQRPFGLFSEPSAMAASLGPWIILLIASALFQSGFHGLSMRSRRAALFAALIGSTLIIFSRSGALFVVLFAATILALPKLYRMATRLGLQNTVLLILGLSTFAVGAYWLSIHMEVRLDSNANTSWRLRAASLQLGFRLLSFNDLSWLLGTGPGVSSVLLQQVYATFSVEGTTTRVVTIWSVLIRYIVETGLYGILTVAIIFGLVIRSIAVSAEPYLGTVCLAVWFVSISAVTSYFPLSAIWLFLALLLNWDLIFPTPSEPVPALQSLPHLILPED